MKKCFLFLLMVSQFSIWAQSPIEILKIQIEAFNNKNVEAMLENITEDFKWVLIMKDSAILETEGIRAFEVAMTNYFMEFNSVKSEVTQSFASGNVISFKEVVSWETDEGIKFQSSIGFYLIVGNKISRAWYIYE